MADEYRGSHVMTAAELAQQAHADWRRFNREADNADWNGREKEADNLRRRAMIARRDLEKYEAMPPDALVPLF
jgi:hypothetical protein